MKGDVNLAFIIVIIIYPCVTHNDNIRLRQTVMNSKRVAHNGRLFLLSIISPTGAPISTTLIVIRPMMYGQPTRNTGLIMLFNCILE